MAWAFPRVKLRANNSRKSTIEKKKQVAHKGSLLFATCEVVSWEEAHTAHYEGKKERCASTIEMQDFGEALQLFARKPLVTPNYAFKLHERDPASGHCSNQQLRIGPGKTGIVCIHIPGGFGFGKTRLGYEAQFINRAIFQNVGAFCSVSAEDQEPLESMKTPLYMYMDVAGALRFDNMLDTKSEDLRLGLRLATRYWVYQSQVFWLKVLVLGGGAGTQRFILILGTEVSGLFTTSNVLSMMAESLAARKTAVGHTEDATTQRKREAPLLIIA